MPIKDIAGYTDVVAKYGQCAMRDFDQVVYVCYDRYYEEDRERHEYILSLVIGGRLGLLEIDMANVTTLQLGRLPQIAGLELDNIKSFGWDRKNFKLYSREYEDVVAYAESCEIKIPQTLR